MSFIIHMPKLSPTMEVGTIASWLVKEGQTIQPGQVIIEVATDKATVEHQALDGGILRKILVPSGGDADINQPIAIVSATKDDDITVLEKSIALQSAALQGAAAQQDALERAALESACEASQVEDALLEKAATSKTGGSPRSALSQPKFCAQGPLEAYDLEADWQPVASHIKASPYAKKLALDRGIDLSGVKGSGPSGRIVAQDLEGVGAASPWGVSLQGEGRPRLVPGTYDLEALTPMRRAIASRLQDSKTFIPHFYLTQEIDASSLSQMQSQLKAQGLKVSLNDLLVRACALALRRHPAINSGFDSAQQKIIRFRTIDVAVAVAVQAGLITPILCHTDYKSVGQISQQIRQLAARAAAGSLKPSEYQGGSFTVSNLGMFGLDQFQAIINPPQAAILAVGAAREKAVVRSSRVEVGLVISLTLSCDHRVIDGADGAKFLASLKQLLESPAILLI